MITYPTMVTYPTLDTQAWRVVFDRICILSRYRPFLLWIPTYSYPFPYTIGTKGRLNICQKRPTKLGRNDPRPKWLYAETTRGRNKRPTGPKLPNSGIPSVPIVNVSWRSLRPEVTTAGEFDGTNESGTGFYRAFEIGKQCSWFPKKWRTN